MKTEVQTFDPAKVESFSLRVMKDTGSFVFGLLAYIGSELGIFSQLVRLGPTTLENLAKEGKYDERHLKEWLGSMVAAEYVEYDPKNGKYWLSPENAAILDDRHSPYYMGGFFKLVVSNSVVVPKLMEVMRNGGGVHQCEYPSEFFTAMEEESRPRYQHHLVDSWIPSIPALDAKLKGGARVLDIGCGGGIAITSMAKHYPQSQYEGCDIHSYSIERANSNARELGVHDKVKFTISGGDDFGEKQYDVITTFDVIHDSINPKGLLKGIKKALRPGGIYLMVEMKIGDNLEDNIGDWGKFLYSVSFLYCMTTSLAGGGAGIGACMGQKKAKELCMEAGFKNFEYVESNDPCFALYVVTNE